MYYFLSAFLKYRNLEAAENNMARLANGLDDVDKQVSLLREQLAVSTREASEIEIGLNKARQTLSVSQNLVHELADEYERWKLQVLNLTSVLIRLNTIFESSSFIPDSWRN